MLRTFLRQMDRRNPDKLKVLQRLDLCYVRVTGFNAELRADVESPEDAPVSVEGVTRDTSAVYQDSGHVRGVLISHGPVPYGGAGRSVQQIALRQRPAATKSRVRLVLQTQNGSTADMSSRGQSLQAATHRYERRSRRVAF